MFYVEVVLEHALVGALEKVDDKAAASVFTVGGFIEEDAFTVIEFSECLVVVFG